MIKAISNLAGFPGYGIFTTGGSNSNEMGFLCAREDALPGSSVTGLSGQTFVHLLLQKHIILLMQQLI